MINKQELIFAVDQDNRVVEPVLRELAHFKGVWHRTTDIWVYNSEGKLLCHKRSMLKDSSAGLWDSTFGGHVLAEEDCLNNALSELREESGISAHKEDLEFVNITKDNRSNTDREFRYNYLYKWDGDVNALDLETDEVDRAEWFSTQEVRVLHNTEPKNWTHPPQLEETLELIEAKIIGI